MIALKGRDIPLYRIAGFPGTPVLAGMGVSGLTISEVSIKIGEDGRGGEIVRATSLAYSHFQGPERVRMRAAQEFAKYSVLKSQNLEAPNELRDQIQALSAIFFNESWLTVKIDISGELTDASQLRHQEALCLSATGKRCWINLILPAEVPVRLVELTRGRRIIREGLRRL